MRKQVIKIKDLEIVTCSFPLIYKRNHHELQINLLNEIGKCMGGSV